MSLLLFVALMAIAVATEGLGEALAGLLVGLGLDIPIALLAGEGIASIFTGWGLVDDAIMMLLRLQLGIGDRFLLGLAVANATHLTEEAYEQWDHSDEENRRYSAWLQRNNPGKTYVFGDVTPTDIFELGASLGVLGYRGTLRTAFQEGVELFADFLA